MSQFQVIEDPTRWLYLLKSADEEGRRKVITVNLPVFTFGRNAGCSIRSESGSWSRLNSTIYRIDGHWYITDNRSLNGTFVNSNNSDNRLKIGEYWRLKEGDIFLCGLNPPSFQVISHDYAQELTGEDTIEVLTISEEIDALPTE